MKKNTQNRMKIRSVLAAGLVMILLLLTGCGQQQAVQDQETDLTAEELLAKAGLSRADLGNADAAYFVGLDAYGNVDLMEIRHDGDLITSMVDSVYYLPENYPEKAYRELPDFARKMKDDLDAEGHLVFTWEQQENCFLINCEMLHLEEKEDVEILRELQMLTLQPGEDGLLSLEESAALLKEMYFKAI